MPKGKPAAEQNFWCLSKEYEPRHLKATACLQKERLKLPIFSQIPSNYWVNPAHPEAYGIVIWHYSPSNNNDQRSFNTRRPVTHDV